MSAIPRTLRELLMEAPDVSATRTVLEQDAFSDLRGRFTNLPEIEWSAVADTVAESLNAALDVKLTDILGFAWTKIQDLQVCLDRKSYPPNETALVPLAEHNIRSTHHPGIELLLGKKVVAEITFDVELTLALEGVVLKIRDGRILEITSGSYSGNGILMFADTVLIKRQTPKYTIPGKLTLGDGVAIPRLPDTL